jgi:hypothetical protein
LSYHQGCITKYVERCWKKHGLQDLKKAKHFLDKYIELNAGRKGAAEVESPTTPPLIQKNVAIQSQLNPTGWVGFVFEGTEAHGNLYTCRLCNAKERVHPAVNPYRIHMERTGCPSIVAPVPEESAYVAQAAD